MVNCRTPEPTIATTGILNYQAIPGSAMEHAGPFLVIYGPKFDITWGLPRVLVGRWLLRSAPRDIRAGGFRFALEIRISAFFGTAGLALEPGGDLADPRTYLRAVHF